MARTAFAAVTAGLLVLAGAQVAIALPRVAERHRAEKGQFEAAAAWLAEHASPDEVVMTTQPHTLNYASGHPTIVLPGSEQPGSAWRAAQEYGARLLIITESFGLYPAILRDEPDPRFRPLEATETLEVYEMVEGEP